MGFKVSDLRPSQITPITPPGKTHLLKVFEVTTADTVSTLKAMLPAQSSVVNVYAHVQAAGAEASSVTISISNNSGVISQGEADATVEGPSLVPMTNLPNLEPVPLNGDLKINALTDSATGGPFRIVVEYVQ